MQNRSLLLRRRPRGTVRKEDFELVTSNTVSLLLAPEGEDVVLVKNLYVSVDPAHRIWISEDAVYVDPVPLDTVMRARTLGVIVQACSSSLSSQWPVGTYVIGPGGVQDYYVGGASLGKPLFKVPDASTRYLSVCSFHIGLTAWHGVRKILRVDSPSSVVVVVSGAAGAVGSLAGQLCRIAGAAKVIGIAGGPDKCRDLVDFYNFDAAVDYKSENSVEDALRKLAPDGVDCYFDNVGGAITDSVLRTMRFFGRVALCGSISEYNNAEDEWPGIRNWNLILQKRLLVRGFICSDHADEFDACFRELCELVRAGAIRYKEDVRAGLENYVEALNLLFRGANTGKLMIQV
jgi:hypothetical protein